MSRRPVRARRPCTCAQAAHDRARYPGHRPPRRRRAITPRSCTPCAASRLRGQDATWRPTWKPSRGGCGNGGKRQAGVAAAHDPQVPADVLVGLEAGAGTAAQSALGVAPDRGRGSPSSSPLSDSSTCTRSTIRAALGDQQGAAVPVIRPRGCRSPSTGQPDVTSSTDGVAQSILDQNSATPDRSAGRSCRGE